MRGIPPQTQVWKCIFIVNNFQGNTYIGDAKAAEENLGATLFDSKKTGGQKRKRNANYDAADVEGYTGPWAKYTDEKTVAVPDPELQKEMDEFTKKVNTFLSFGYDKLQRQMKSRKFRQQQKEAEGPAEETTQLHRMFFYYLFY